MNIEAAASIAPTQKRLHPSSRHPPIRHPLSCRRVSMGRQSVSTRATDSFHCAFLGITVGDDPRLSRIGCGLLRNARVSATSSTVPASPEERVKKNPSRESRGQHSTGNSRSCHKQLTRHSSDSRLCLILKGLAPIKHFAEDRLHIIGARRSTMLRGRRRLQGSAGQHLCIDDLGVGMVDDRKARERIAGKTC